MVAMQKPTLRNLKIRSISDAHRVLFAVARTLLPLITRRLSTQERRAIVSGDVYVWEERVTDTKGYGPSTGMERWTDGMLWGPSRARDGFLFYSLKDSDFRDDRNLINVYQIEGPDDMSEAERLMKQTYSVFIMLPDANRQRYCKVIRKWHLTAYFTQYRVNSLSTVDEIPGICDVEVPDGWFSSVRPAKTRRNHNDWDLSHRMPHTSVNHPTTMDPTPPLSDRLSGDKHCMRATPELSPRSKSPPDPSGRGHTSDLTCNPSAREKSMSHSPSSHILLPVCKQLPPLHDHYPFAYQRRVPIDEQYLRRFSGCPF